MNAQSVRQMWHIYVRKGEAFVPNVAQTEATFFLDVEPVRVVGLNDSQFLAQAIEQAMAAGNPRVPTPTRATFPKPVILKPASVRSWNAFVEGGACFTIFRGDDEIEITETARDVAGEWVDAPSLTEKLSPTSSSSEIAQRIIERTRKRADLK